ncbi:MAG TPA: tyrosine-type recombinase/integrase [Armatimonadota bacterium]|nr:tyrosine-type recombinase/integrase [Armatimonadota bacterium]
MEDVLSGFRAELERQDLSPATVRGYINDVELFARWYTDAYGEQFDPARIVQREVSEYRAWMQQKPAAAETINRRLTSIRKFFDWLGGNNPAAAVKGVAIVDPGVQALSTPELRRLMREVHVHGVVRDIAILEVLCGTAIRVGELVQLRVGDVEISERRGAVKVRSGKGRTSREIPLNVDVRKALAAWIAASGQSEWLFTGQRGRLTAVGVWRVVRKYGKFAGIPNLRVHQLRHTVLTRLVRECGADLATVARISGHRDIRTLTRYIEPTQDDLAQAVEKLALGGE